MVWFQTMNRGQGLKPANKTYGVSWGQQTHPPLLPDLTVTNGICGCESWLVSVGAVFVRHTEIFCMRR